MADLVATAERAGSTGLVQREGFRRNLLVQRDGALFQLSEPYECGFTAQLVYPQPARTTVQTFTWTDAVLFVEPAAELIGKYEVERTKLSTAQWNALTSDQAKAFVSKLARYARVLRGVSQESPSDNRRRASRTASYWERLVKDQLPYVVSTSVMVDSSGRAWAGMWMTYHQGSILSGSV